MSEYEELAEKKVSSEVIFEGQILHVERDHVKLPNGDIKTRELIRHIGAVCMVPVTADNQIIMERQYRYPMDEVFWEIPAGKLDASNENRLSAAKRELQEETGFTADEWTELGIYYPTIAYSDEKITMYMARGLHLGERNLDDDEFINVTTIPIERVIKMIMDGEITDGKTQTAVLKAARALGV